MESSNETKELGCIVFGFLIVMIVALTYIGSHLTRHDEEIHTIQHDIEEMQEKLQEELDEQKKSMEAQKKSLAAIAQILSEGDENGN